MFAVNSFSVCPDSLISEISKISKCKYLPVSLCSIVWAEKGTVRSYSSMSTSESSHTGIKQESK